MFPTFARVLAQIEAPTQGADAVQPDPAAPTGGDTSSATEPAATPQANETSPDVDGQPSLIDGLGDTAHEVKGLLSGAVRGDWESIVALAVQYLLPAIGLLLVLVAAYFVARFLSRLVSGPVSRRVDATLGRFLGKLVFNLVMIGAILGVLGSVGVNVAAFAAILAAAGFAIGLAFQGTLSNFASGIMLLVFRPFKVGDAINAAGITAKVAEIDLFFTIFDTFDNRRIIVPNADVFSGTIENITHHPVRRAEIKVGVDYGCDLDEARAALNRAAESVPGVQQGEGRGHQVMVMEFGGSSIDWVVRAWFTREDFWTDREQLIHAIKRELDAAGIGIPFPQMDVHLDRRRG